MHWIALLPEPVTTDTADTPTDPSAALGWWALRYTPKVARVGEAIVLEVSASARLWHGLPTLITNVIQSNKPVDIAKYAQGATSLIALAELSTNTTKATQAATNQTADALPLHTLAAAAPHLDTLERIGVRTWGQLRALPRGGISRRFGAALLNALDQAYGAQPEVYPWLTLPEVFEASLELSAQVETATALLFAARRLLAQLKTWLQLRHQGVLALELVWLMDERRNTDHQGKLLLRTALPTQDSPHLQRLLAEHLAQVKLPAPAHTLRLRSVEVAAITGLSQSLLPDDFSQGDHLHQTLERLSARLGADAVLQLQVRLDHRPEKMQAWSGFTPQFIAACAYSKRVRTKNSLKPFPLSIGVANPGWPQATLPTWLLDVPLKLNVLRQRPHYLGALTLLHGPQRLETGWWDGNQPALRDYFVAQSTQAGLLWIYRERLPASGNGHGSEPGWYLHGLFA